MTYSLGQAVEYLRGGVWRRGWYQRHEGTHVIAKPDGALVYVRATASIRPVSR